MPIITIDCYDDAIENQLQMVQMMREERKSVATVSVAKVSNVSNGRFVPNEVWGLIKAFAGYTPAVRAWRIKKATSALKSAFEIHEVWQATEKKKKDASAWGCKEEYKSIRKDIPIRTGDQVEWIRKAPTVKIGDEVHCYGQVCGLVSKINKASIDIKVYGWIYYGDEEGENYWTEDGRFNMYSRYKWKKDIIRDTPIRWIGSYKVGEFNKGFTKRG